MNENALTEQSHCDILKINQSFSSFQKFYLPREVRIVRVYCSSIQLLINNQNYKRKKWEVRWKEIKSHTVHK